MMKRARDVSNRPRNGVARNSPNGPLFELSLAEWAVLAAIGEGRTHGFEVARRFAQDGTFGRVWTIRRPLVYRAIRALVDSGLVRELPTARSSDGPPRRPIEMTDRGAGALAGWLGEPIVHVRDARSELLLKLLFCERRSLDPTPLLRDQREVLDPILSGLQSQLANSTGFDATLARWRFYSAEALARFVEGLLPRSDDR